MTQQEKRRQKKRQGIIALTLILLLSATGTFAWYSFTQRAVNPLWAMTNYGGRIHDNFDGYRGYDLSDDEQRDAADAPNHTGGAGLRNKDVYVENFGERPFYVRIQLLEYLAFEGVPVNDYNWSVDDPRGENGNAAWSPFISERYDVNARLEGTPAGTIGDHNIRWQLGHHDEKIFMPTFNRATYQVEEQNIGGDVPEMFAHPNAYLMTDATGYGVDWLSTREEVGRDVPEHGDILHASNFQEIGRQSAPGLDADRHRVYDGFGLHDNWQVGDTLTSSRIYTPEVGTDRHLVVEDDAVTHRAMATMEPSIYGVTDAQLEAEIGQTVATFTGIMTIRNWHNLGRPDGNFWIHDTTDPNGWFYWNGLLMYGEEPDEGVTNATSLLLDEVFVPAFDTSWEYVIVVEGEFFTGDSLDRVDYTPDAEYIFNRDRERPRFGGNITVSGRGDVDYDIEGLQYSEPDPETGRIVIRIPVGSVPADENPNLHINREALDGWEEYGPIGTEPEDGYFIWIVSPPGPTCEIVWTDAPINLVRDGEGVLVTEGTGGEPLLYCQTFFQDAPERVTDATPEFTIVGEDTEGITLDDLTVYADEDATPGPGRYVEVRFPTAPVPPTPAYARRPILVSYVTATACLENGYFVDEGVIWCRILEDGDYSLMITYHTYVIGGTDMRFGPEFAQWADNPEIRPTVENWFNTTASEALLADTATGILPTESLTVLPTNDWTDNQYISEPDRGTAGSGTAFLPSLSELNAFAGAPAPSTLQFGGETPGIERLGASAIGGNLVNGDLGVTWLRSPAYSLFGQTMGWTLYSMHGENIDRGQIYSTFADWEGFGFDDYGVRPTIWIQTNDWID